MPVSQVADLLDQPETVETPTPDAGDWSSQRQQLLAVIEAVDLPKLEALYHQSLALYPLSVAINELWQPVILTLEAKWAAQPDDLVRRTFEAFLRSQVGIRLHYANQATRGPLILLSAMPDDPGPLWVLMSALMASEQATESSCLIIRWHSKTLHKRCLACTPQWFCSLAASGNATTIFA